MKLLYSPISPFARKVRVAAAELGLSGRLTLEQALVSPTKPNRAYGNTVSPLRKIPALITDDGHAIYDSLVICDYLDALAGGGRLIPTHGQARWQALTNHALADGMCQAAVLIRYEKALRPEQYRWTDWIDDQWDRVLSGLSWFEQRPDAVAGPLDLSRITLGCLLGYLDIRFDEENWRKGHPALAAWFADTSKRPSFVSTFAEPPQ